MTAELCIGHQLSCRSLQWGHGAWPWMTLDGDETFSEAVVLQWGHGAWPWMTGNRR